MEAGTTSPPCLPAPNRGSAFPCTGTGMRPLKLLAQRLIVRGKPNARLVFKDPIWIEVFEAGINTSENSAKYQRLSHDPPTLDDDAILWVGPTV